MIGDEGNLSHFDGSGWDTRNLKGILPGASQIRKDDNAQPRLELTSNGRLWLIWHGIWVQDDEVWREVRPPGIDPKQVWLASHDPDKVWLWHWGANEIAVLTADGDVTARYGLREMGLSKLSQIRGVTASGGQIWVATGEGLLVSGGGQWRNMGLPPGYTSLMAVAIAPDGGTWVVGQKEPLARYAPHLAAVVLEMIVMALLVAMWLRGRAENRLAAEQALTSAAGYLPGMNRGSSQTDVDQRYRWVMWAVPAGLVGFPLGIVAVSMAVRLLRSRWPGAPEWGLYTGVLLTLALAGLKIWQAVSRRRASIPANALAPQPHRFPPAFRRPATWILYIAVWASLARWVPWTWVDRTVPIAALRVVFRYAVVGLLTGIIINGRNILASGLVTPAWKVGDYDRAIRWLRWLSLGSPNYTMIGMEGVTHELAGRPVDAERCFRQGMTKSLTLLPDEQVRLLDSLGEALGDQGRYEEAKKCFQYAIEVGGTRPSLPRFGLAELLLKQGAEAQKAMDLIDEGTRMEKGRLKTKAEPVRLAARAWALALLGRRQEAEEAIERAVQGRRFFAVSLLASTRWQAGMALLALGETGKAVEHFRAARDADPKGKYCALAIQQLKRHSVWGQ